MYIFLYKYYTHAGPGIVLYYNGAEYFRRVLFMVFGGSFICVLVRDIISLFSFSERLIIQLYLCIKLFQRV